jgi:hypothetical protein
MDRHSSIMRFVSDSYLFFLIKHNIYSNKLNVVFLVIDRQDVCDTFRGHLDGGTIDSFTSVMTSINWKIHNVHKFEEARTVVPKVFIFNCSVLKGFKDEEQERLKFLSRFLTRNLGHFFCDLDYDFFFFPFITNERNERGLNRYNVSLVVLHVRAKVSLFLFVILSFIPMYLFFLYKEVCVVFD